MKGLKHGHAYEPIYSVWREMNRRCFSENCCNYHKYGALGISVCKEWRRNCDGGINGFENFYDWAINNGYKQGLTLDRINQFKNYCPENCKWSTYTDQNLHLTINKNNKSGYIGISWSEKDKRWRSRIKVNGMEINIGYFKSKRDAYDARVKYIKDNNLSNQIQPWIGEDGYRKQEYKNYINGESNEST